MAVGVPRQNVDGRKFYVEELAEGFVVMYSEPNGPTVRKAALTPAQILARLKEFGLDLGLKEEVH